MSKRLVLLLAVTCGVAVGNLYFPQAVTPIIAEGLDVAPASAALAATAAQAGYSVGILLLVPLGDRLPNRPLIAGLLGLTGLLLLAAGLAPALPVLVAAGALVGTATVAAQLIAPMAAATAAADRRGEVMGTLLSGSIGGMLLARGFGGVLADQLGWRAPYLVAAVAVLLLAAVLAAALPTTVPSGRQPYPALLAAPLRLLRTEPDLRRSCLYQACVFGAFSAAWTGMALVLTGPVYGLGASAAGAVALVAAASMALTPVAGRWVDRRGPDAVGLVCMLGALASAGPLALGALGGAAGLAALTAGILLLDVAMQSGMVANQARVFALRPEARGRINTAYMTCAFLGGTAGSWLGVQAFALARWPGVCAVAALLCAVALGRHLVHLRRVGRGSWEAGAPAAA
ncbi:MFS transporter [Nocardiopsis halophila]|uniref:MFS transporter n=1 Tax=Nocardiopsis halophila TaxID=141692 RepID=UPI00047838EF|nr:MFS transporter [Nocardiopsis halophila]